MLVTASRAVKGNPVAPPHRPRPSRPAGGAVRRPGSSEPSWSGLDHRQPVELGANSWQLAGDVLGLMSIGDVEEHESVGFRRPLQSVAFKRKHCDDEEGGVEKAPQDRTYGRGDWKTAVSWQLRTFTGLAPLSSEPYLNRSSRSPRDTITHLVSVVRRETVLSVTPGRTISRFVSLCGVTRERIRRD